MKLKQPDPTAQRLTMQELVKRSGVSLASIKFYAREQLLQSGDLEAENRAYYDQRHLDRLALIRALRELGNVPVDQLRKLIRASERATSSTFKLVATVVDTLAGRTREPDAALRALRQQVHQKLTQQGLDVRDDSATLDALSDALRMLLAYRPELKLDVIDDYLDHLLPLAAAEVDANRERLQAGAEPALLGAIVGTVLFEPIIVLLRRLAHEHFARRLDVHGRGP